MKDVTWKNLSWKRVLARQETILLAILLGYSAVVTIINPAFLLPSTIFDILKGAAGPLLLALGTLVVMISGGVDVSSTAVAVVSGYASIWTIMALGIDNVLVAFVLSIAIGVALGAINGAIIHKFELPTLIATLGTQNMFVGAMATFIGTTFISSRLMPDSIVAMGRGALVRAQTGAGEVGLTVMILPVIALTILTWFVLRRTMIGRSIFALGSDGLSARRAGLNLFRVRMFVYMYAGGLAGVMGVIYAANTRSLNPLSLVGDELNVIAAVVLGGARLTGGVGTVLGTVLGVAIVTVLQQTLVLIGLSSSWNQFFVGIIILLSVGITSYRTQKTNRKNLTFISVQ